MSAIDPARASSALADRLALIAPELGLPPLADETSASLLQRLIAAVGSSGARDELWLLVTGVTAAFPERSDLEAARAALFAPEAERFAAFLSAVAPLASRSDLLDAPMDLVTGPLVDVHFCATEEHNSGVQRVVRETLGVLGDRGQTLVAWTPVAAGYRPLSAQETARVTNWHGQRDTLLRPGTAERLLVPWRSVLVLPEVPRLKYCAMLAALAEHSGNRVVVIGYDLIPIVSADHVGAEASEAFAHYLTIVKHAHRVAAISEAAAEEFRGFVDALPSQGLAGPTVSSVLLPIDHPAVTDHVPAAPGTSPLVLSVGSQEPRKNQDALLHAAEVLWAEGLDFRLRFIGGGTLERLDRFDRQLDRLRRRGRQVDSLRGATDAELMTSYSEAALVAFPSLHEGYGLPVAEALALGVPVLTSAHGSTAEIAVAGGCHLVDPRDDEAIIDGLRLLLTDPDLLATLTAEARSVSARSWSDYADELWTALVEVPHVRD